ncbi:MAG: hypothetical protein HY362_01420 [Candidatus Aenigmarchaeota archaeon]|nr:hypothetical protein [Candidatus Aenigmarchaeota archaeon]
MSVTIATAMFIAFAVAYLVLPRLIEFLKLSGMVGIDVQKIEKPKIAEMGGPAVVVGFLIGIFAFIGARVFLYDLKADIVMVKILISISTILIVVLIGMFDDLGRLIKKKMKKDVFGNIKRIGLKQWQKPLFTLPAAIPLMAILAGNTVLYLPVLGPVDLGILYPLLIVPIAIVGASNATNMLAGLNGLEAGLGAVTLGSIGIFALIIGEIPAASIALIFAAGLFAFFLYNKYPAKIMPGDSLTYAIGAVIATAAIIGNMERFVAFLFLPWFIEFALKARSRFKAQSFGILQKDGSLKSKYDKIYSLTHVFMNGRNTERGIVYRLVGLQIILCMLGFALFFMKLL